MRRYIRKADKQRIAEAFRLGALPESFVLPPDYNVAPTTFQPVIRLNRDTGEREVIMMRWGLIPYLAKPAAEFKGVQHDQWEGGDGIGEASWRGPFQKRRRCLVPTDGFYEAED